MKENGRPLLALLLIFATPLGLAFWLYYGSHWRPALRTNHGELVEPVVPLPALRADGATADALKGKWSLLVVGDGAGGCGDQCRVALVYARQTWLSLGKLAPRVQRVLLAGIGCCDHDYLRDEQQGLIVTALPDPAVATVRTKLPPPFEGTVYVVDPLGNLMMRYDVRQDPKGLREDLKNLLELSHIG